MSPYEAYAGPARIEARALIKSWRRDIRRNRAGIAFNVLWAAWLLLCPPVLYIGFLNVAFGVLHWHLLRRAHRGLGEAHALLLQIEQNAAYFKAVREAREKAWAAIRLPY